MKQLDSIDSLNAIRQKVTTRQTDFNQKELLLLEEVYSEIQSKFVGKKNVILDKGCSSCISSAANIVFNYINFHEPRQIEIEKPIPVEDVEKVLQALKNNNGKTLVAFTDNEEYVKMVEEIGAKDFEVTDGILQVPGLKEAIDSKKELKDMKLSELRQLYPNIKARSVKEFLHELNQSENGTSNENIQD